METNELAILISRLFDEALAHIPDQDDEVFCLRVRELEFFVASDSTGRLLAILPSADDEINLASTRFSFASRKRITWRDRPADRQEFAVLYLTETSALEIDQFVEVIVSLYQCLQSGMAGNQLARIIESWFGLLISGDEPTYSAVLGLWGELFIISMARDIRAVIGAWQWRDTEPLDFLYRGSAVEVKCTTGSFREHSTSLTQSLAAANLRTAVASVITQDEIEGTSIYEIYNSLLVSVGDDPVLAAKLVSAFARRVGFSRRIHDWTFSLDKARESLVFASWDKLPSADFGDGITSARWSFVLHESHTCKKDQLSSIDLALSEIF
jgi:hypothetical protein